MWRYVLEQMGPSGHAFPLVGASCACSCRGLSAVLIRRLERRDGGRAVHLLEGSGAERARVPTLVVANPGGLTGTCKVRLREDLIEGLR